MLILAVAIPLYLVLIELIILDNRSNVFKNGSIIIIFLWGGLDSNQRPYMFKIYEVTLSINTLFRGKISKEIVYSTTELPPHIIFCGPGGTRTHDVISQAA